MSDWDTRGRPITIARDGHAILLVIPLVIQFVCKFCAYLSSIPQYFTDFIVCIIVLAHCQDDDQLKALQDRALALNQAEQALQAARSEKTQVEQRMVQLNGDCQRLSQQLQQKDAECQRSRDLVRWDSSYKTIWFNSFYVSVSTMIIGHRLRSTCTDERTLHSSQRSVFPDGHPSTY